MYRSEQQNSDFKSVGIFIIGLALGIVAGSFVTYHYDKIQEVLSITEVGEGAVQFINQNCSCR